MPLPQQVIERLGKEPPRTPGWSVGALTFSGAVLFITVLIYFGLTLGYEPYLKSSVEKINGQIDALAKTVSADDQTHFITFYSRISNLNGVLINHVLFSNFLSWLEKNTEANVYYSHFSFSSGSQISLSGLARAEADVNQQMAILEAAPEVKSAVISSISFSDTANLWQFNLALTMNQSVFRASP